MTKAQVRPSRRGFFMGASAVTAVAAVATVSQKLATSENAAPTAQPAPERGGGYNLDRKSTRLNSSH